MNTNTYDNLKTYQQEFVRMIANAWLAGAPAVTLKADHGFNRSYLREIAINNGMKWAPAWIVKDKNRKKNRGYYMVPEVADYILSVMPNEKSAQDVPATSAEMEPVAV